MTCDTEDFGKRATLPKHESDAADFETAVSHAGFGGFNLLLLLIAIPSTLAIQYEMASLSFVFPVAQCDLNLSLEQRGVVNALVFAGMMCGCFFWGPFSDVIGRKKVLVVTHFTDLVFAATAALSQNYAVLATAKFFGGLMISGQSMTLHPYFAEFHGSELRSRVPLTVGLLYNVGTILLPLLAWAILPMEQVKFGLMGFEYHAWNIYLLVGVAMSFVGGMAFIMMPETPRFLMSKGLNKDALAVFKKMYALNTGHRKTKYPVVQLSQDNCTPKQKGFEFKASWRQISPLFSAKYRTKLMLVCMLQFSVALCTNTLRLWLPEMLQVTNDYEYYNKEKASFCKMIASIDGSAAESDEPCNVNLSNSSVYINSAAIGGAICLAYILAAFVINIVGKKRMMVFSAAIAGVAAILIYFASNMMIAVVLICINLACSSVCIDVVITICIDLFETQLRVSALSLCLTSGRVGAILGNLLFPMLLQAGCAPPFVTLGCVCMVCATLSAFLPNTDSKALE